MSFPSHLFLPLSGAAVLAAAVLGTWLWPAPVVPPLKWEPPPVAAPVFVQPPPPAPAPRPVRPVARVVPPAPPAQPVEPPRPVPVAPPPEPVQVAVAPSYPPPPSGEAPPAPGPSAGAFVASPPFEAPPGGDSDGGARGLPGARPPALVGAPCGSEPSYVQIRRSSVAASASGTVQMVVGRITSGFGARWGTSHQGLDIAAPIGTPIRVPLDGTVTDSGAASGFGQWVRVRHDDGTLTVYGHISRSHVSVGESVSAGEVIAEVGNEGRSTGAHLHFEVVTPGGSKINPRPWLDERGIGLT